MSAGATAALLGRIADGEQPDGPETSVSAITSAIHRFPHDVAIQIHGSFCPILFSCATCW